MFGLNRRTNRRIALPSYPDGGRGDGSEDGSSMVSAGSSPNTNSGGVSEEDAEHEAYWFGTMTVAACFTNAAPR